MRRLLFLLLGASIANATAGEPFAQPLVMRFGATTTELQSALIAQNVCKTLRLRPIVPPFLDNIKVAQQQIDCDGFTFMGRPRWTEFVIGDDALKMVWIMTTPAENQTLEAAMTAAYGPPTRRSKTYIAYEQARVALRLDKAEVLFYAPDLDTEAAGWFAERSISLGGILFLNKDGP